MFRLFYTSNNPSIFELDGYRQTMNENFSQDEIKEYSAIRVSKRRDEWLASRIITKKLVLEVDKIGISCLRDLRVSKEASGAPFIQITSGERISGSLSLSHSHGQIFCGYSYTPNFKFGLDIEKIEHREIEFVEDYFTPGEIRTCNICSVNDQDEITTLIWSAKEATLKVIRKGLAIDTRRVNVSMDTNDTGLDGWKSCLVRLENARYKVYWRRIEDFIQTISFPQAFIADLHEIVL